MRFTGMRRNPFNRNRRSRFSRTRRMGRRQFRSRRFRPRRNRSNGNFFCKGKTSITIVVAGTGTQLQIVPTINGFVEFNNLKNNFEAYKIRKVKVKITPRANTSYPGGVYCGNYISAPYHKPVTTSTVTEESLLSIDKSRVYSGFATSTRSYVPAILELVLVSTGATPTTQASKTCWKPRIEINGTSSFDIPHFCGLYYFSGQNQYDVETTVMVEFINQKNSTLT
ncbi:capsid protein [robinz virus RP_526]|uniref:Capsid protein n=1 Tax=robinz virus RP_526 TaxID=2886399 RepID=A0A8K1UFD6_9CIRC|nr:capsid protein [robinz virus RP_526]UDN67411.1 capsid protein [robinz virus RP_526]